MANTDNKAHRIRISNSFDLYKESTLINYIMYNQWYYTNIT